MELTPQQRVGLRKFVEAIVFTAIGIAFWRYGPTWRLPRSVHYFVIIVTPIAGFVLYRTLVLLVTKQLEPTDTLSLNHATEPSSRNKQYQFPKRFGLITLAIATTGIAMLAGLLLALGVSHITIAGILAFVSCVTIMQSVLDRAPRSASILAGAILLPLFSLLPARGHNISTDEFVTMCIAYTAVGALLGYLTGGLVAGIFLASDVIKAWWHPSASEATPSGPSSPWD